MAMSKTRRLKRARPAQTDFGTAFVQLLKSRLTEAAKADTDEYQPDPRSHAEFLRDMRAKQAAGKLANPATSALLDRLERVTHAA